MVGLLASLLLLSLDLGEVDLHVLVADASVGIGIDTR